MSLSQVALAWCAQQLDVTSPIIGPRTMEHLEDNLRALDITLGRDDLECIDDAIPPGSHDISPYYETDPQAKYVSLGLSQTLLPTLPP